ncbi:MAG: hypothetical protein EOO43_09925, partial [Flavobacterium sp.]
MKLPLPLTGEAKRRQFKKIPHSLLPIHYFTILATFKRNMNKFFGTGVAMVTPFQADGQVDYDGL